MTEAEWLASEDPKAMLAALRWPDEPPGRVGYDTSDRKLRLFALALARARGASQGHCLPYEDGGSYDSGLSTAWWEGNLGVWLRITADKAAVAALLRDIIGNPFAPATLPPGPAVRCKACDGRGWRANTTGQGSTRQWCGCDKGWSRTPGPSPVLTPDVMRLAHVAYEGGWDALPALSDALVDAGCHDEVLLGHLRSTGPHCRGCYAVDLILGKS
jgi:hypothetical protein